MQTFESYYKELVKKYSKEEVEAGMDVEKEHDNITKKNKLQTAKIVAAHLKEKPNYYSLLKKCVEK